eukprot:1160282-Pelagomonas_calceolata.AAC.8
MHAALQLDEVNPNGMTAPKTYSLQRNAGATQGPAKTSINITQPIRNFTEQVCGCGCVFVCGWLCARACVCERLRCGQRNRVGSLEMPARPSMLATRSPIKTSTNQVHAVGWRA